MTHPLKQTNCIAVEVHKDADEVWILGEVLWQKLNDIVCGSEYLRSRDSLQILPYTLIGVWPDVTEEQAQEVVQQMEISVEPFMECWNFGSITFSAYVDYVWLKSESAEATEGYDSAVDSLRSLLHSNSLDTSKRWAIVKPTTYIII